MPETSWKPTSKLKRLWQRIRAVFGSQVTIQLIQKKFEPVEEKHNPEPVAINGYEIENGTRSILVLGSEKKSRGATFPPQYAGNISLRGKTKVRVITEPEGKVHIVLSKPTEQELTV